VRSASRSEALAALAAPLLTAVCGLIGGRRSVPHGPSMCWPPLPPSSWRFGALSRGEREMRARITG